MNTIRTEAEGTNDLNHVSQWLSRHRGQTVELDRTKQLEFGVPISGARAVLVAVTLQADGAPAPLFLAHCAGPGRRPPHA